MKVDIYSLEPKRHNVWGPLFRSFDNDFLLNPSGEYCKGFFQEDGIKYFADLFFPEEMRKIKNGLQKVVSRQDIRKANLTEKISETKEIIDNVRGQVIDRFGVNSHENFYMVDVQRFVESMFYFSKYLLKNSRNALVVTHNANPKKEESKYREDDVSANSACVIHGASIETVDQESQTYTGKVLWSDYIEGCDPISSFIAHPIPEKVNFYNKERLFVRELDIHCLTGGYHITCQPDTNRIMEQYINELIES